MYNLIVILASSAPLTKYGEADLGYSKGKPSGCSIYSTAVPIQQRGINNCSRSFHITPILIFLIVTRLAPSIVLPRRLPQTEYRLLVLLMLSGDTLERYNCSVLAYYHTS